MSIWTTLFLFACGDEEDKTGTTSTTTVDGEEADALLNVDVPPVGDLTCFEGGFEVVGSWNTQEVDDSKKVEVPFDGMVIDFESDEPVEDALLEVWYGTEIVNAPAFTANSDAAGVIGGTIMTCSPYSYRVSTDPALGDTKVTMESPQIDDHTTSSADPVFNSVSAATYAVIPSLLGVSPDPVNGVVAGRASDCGNNELEGAQVIVKDPDGNIPAGVVVKYFVDNFPNRNQEWTSADGLWVAINVPPSLHYVEMYVYDEAASSHILMGKVPIDVKADSINISNVVASMDDGMYYPEGCLTGATSEPAAEPASEPSSEEPEDSQEDTGSDQ